MSKGLLFALTTLIGFAAGVFAGMQMEVKRAKSVPPPPTGLLNELRDMPLAPTTTKPATAPASTRENEKYELFKAELDAFQKKLEPLKTEFRQNLAELLTTEQRERLKAMSERPLPKDGQTSKKKSRYAEGVDSIIPIVFVPPTLDRLSDELQLDDVQRKAVCELLMARRKKFLELVDESPPPSFKLGTVAPQTAEPPKASGKK